MAKNELFIERFETLRNSKGLSTSQLLKELHLASGAFATWKSRGTIPNGDILAKIADYFNVSTDYLLGKTEVRNYEETARKCMLRTPEEEQELNEYLEQVHNDPNLRMMFKLTKGATKADVEKAVEIIKTLLGK